MSLHDSGGNQAIINADGSLRVSETGGGASATWATVDVASSASAVTLKAANANRRGLIIANDSTSLLYVLYGSGTPSASLFTYAVGPGATLEMAQPLYTGIVKGVWVSANGTAGVSEAT